MTSNTQLTSGLSYLQQTISVAVTSTAQTLTLRQYSFGTIIFTGTLTGNTTITFPMIPQRWNVINNTTGGYTLTLSAGTGPTVTISQNNASTFICDGSTGFYRVVTDAPTPAQFDNTQSIATTAFVQRALGSMSSVVSYASAGGVTLTSANVGQLIDLIVGYSGTVTLPSASTISNGSCIAIFNASGSTITVQRSGTDNIYPSGLATSSVSIVSGDSMLFTQIGSATWNATGTAQLQYSGLFASSLSANGYQKLPSGLIVQWGIVTASAANTMYTFTFPITFPSSGSNTRISTNVISGGTATTSSWHATPTSSSVQVAISSSSGFVDVIAIGY